MEKERHKLECKDRKKAPGARASMPKALEIGAKLPGVTKDDEEIDLNTSLASVVAGEDLRNNVGKN